MEEDKFVHGSVACKAYGRTLLDVFQAISFTSTSSTTALLFTPKKGNAQRRVYLTIEWSGCLFLPAANQAVNRRMHQFFFLSFIDKFLMWGIEQG